MGQPVTDFVNSRLSPSTVLKYGAFVLKFRRWLAGYEIHDPTSVVASALPSGLPVRAEIIVDYLVDSASQRRPDGDWLYSYNTLKLWLAGINWHHTRAGFDAPGDRQVVRDVMTRLRLERPAPRMAPAMSMNELRQLLEHIRSGSTLSRALRSRDALFFLFAFAGAFITTEVIDLHFDDVEWTDDGLVISVRAGNGTSAHRAQTKLLPFGSSPLTCPPCALGRWVATRKAASRLGSHDFVVGGEAEPDQHVCSERPDIPADWTWLVARVDARGVISDLPVTRCALNIALARHSNDAGFAFAGLSGRSLRAGFVTEALRAGLAPAAVAAHSGHASVHRIEEIGKRSSNRPSDAARSVGL